MYCYLKLIILFAHSVIVSSIPLTIGIKSNHLDAHSLVVKQLHWIHIWDTPPHRQPCVYFEYEAS